MKAFETLEFVHRLAVRQDMGMRLLLLVFFFGFSGCGQKPRDHIQILPKFAGPAQNITLLAEDDPKAGGSEPTHNIEPPRGREIGGRWKIFSAENNCLDLGKASLCYSSDRIKSRLHLFANINGSRVDGPVWGGSLGDIFRIFVGGPAASIYFGIDFGSAGIGLLHSYGFTLFRDGKFCASLETNPNSRMWFGIDDRSVPLIFSSPALTSADREVDGWREYPASEMCQ